jgi:hypothetical protein
MWFIGLDGVAPETTDHDIGGSVPTALRPGNDVVESSGVFRAEAALDEDSAVMALPVRRRVDGDQFLLSHIALSQPPPAPPLDLMVVGEVVVILHLLAVGSITAAIVFSQPLLGLPQLGVALPAPLVLVLPPARRTDIVSSTNLACGGLEG